MNCVDGTTNMAQMECPVLTSSQTLNLFTEIIICQHLVIPPQKPDKEHITNTLKNFLVTDVQVVEVDLGDGVIRKKVVVSGTLKLGIEYSADEPEQQVHFAHFDIPFSGIIGYRPCDPATNRGLILDSDFPPDGFDIDDFNINLCLEHEQYHQLNPRDIKAVLVLLIWLEPKS
ncbi:MAG: hypothetical protein XD78_1774 [Desulfotomaculum sp. 46_296]|nr:MAG: hypothetical protein XD78_1774 [Desulfotomaculum sp. 46_296]HAU32375.1 hypothetical protein [Desulfotomaculum sp.]